MAAQFPTNVVVLPRPAPTTTERNRAAEAFALSLECAAVGDIAGEEAALQTALEAAPDDPATNVNYGNRMCNSGRFQEALACYNTAVGADAANVLALFNRGNVLVACRRGFVTGAQRWNLLLRGTVIRIVCLTSLPY
jgi:tetratricopeptide (TPR) repeat protein